MNVRLVGVVGCAALLGLPGISQAQTGVTVRQVIRVVKTGRAGSPQLTNARVGGAIAPGDRVRTAGRSYAGLRFPDDSVVRLGELTEVVVTNANTRHLQVNRGEVVASYKAPGVISGGYAVAAVRGTDIHYAVNEATKSAIVRCYEGRVFVSSADNPIAAGASRTYTPTTVVNPTLIGNAIDYRGGDIRFTDGPFKGEIRRITSVNGETGTVSFEPALPGGPAPAEEDLGFILSLKPGVDIVELGRNQGTVINAGKAPSRPKSVPARKFAMLQAKSFDRVVDDAGGNSVAATPYVGSDTHQGVQNDTVAERQATIIAARAGQVGDVQDCLDFGVGAARFASVRPSLRNFSFSASQTVPGTTQSPQPPGTTPEQRMPPAGIFSIPPSVALDDKVAFRFEPFGVLSSDADIIGARARLQASSGDAYMELGYRYALIDGQSNHELAEAFLTLRGDYGDVTAGRQHLFLRLANNTNIGTLLGLETTDAVTWQLPLRGGYRQSFGYIWNTTPVASARLVGSGSDSQHAWYGRGQAPLFRGNVGYSVFLPTRDDRNVGWSLDASQAVGPNVLDAYGEVGRDDRNRSIAVAGLYVPYLFQRFGLDTFVEYHRREGIDERFTLRLRRQVVRNLLLIGFVDRYSR